MDATSTAVLSAFSVVLGQQEGDRRSAEQNLTALEVLDSYPVILVNLVSDEQVAVEVRQLAAVTLKRYICSHWSSTECQSFTPPETTEEAKSHARTLLLRTLSSPIRLVRTAVAHTIATIAQFDWPDAWPTLLSDITAMIDQVAEMGQDATSMERSKGLVHGCIRVLAAISGEISDLDVPKVAPVLVPSLMRVVCDKQRFGTATRRNALIVMNNLIDTVVNSDGEDAFNRFISPYLRPCMNVIFSDLTSQKVSLEESAFQSELIQLLTYLCVELREFVGSCLDGGLTQLMTILWQILLRISDTFVQSKVAVRPHGEPGVEADVVDSDGETVEYEALVYSLLELLSSLVSAKRYRTKLVPYLANVCFQLALLMQLPEDAIHRWANGLADFMEESDEALGCSVRLTTLDVLRKFSSRFSNWTEAFHTSLSRLFLVAEEQHTKCDPSWWKLLEVALHLCASFPRCFNPEKSKPSSTVPTSLDPNLLPLDTIYARYVLPSLQQTDFPFLQVSALHCASELAVQSIPNGPKLSDLPVLLVGALAHNQHAVLRCTAVREISAAGSKFRHFRKTTAPDSAGESVQLLISHLPNLVTGVVDCLSQFGEPLLNDGLDALCGLLRVDQQGFTCSARSQVTSILVELFKHCFSVAGTLSLYLDVLRVVCETDRDSSNEPIEQAFLSTLSTCLEQPDNMDTVAIEAALQVLCVLIETSRPTVSNLLIQRMFPVVVHIAISNTDSMVISGCCEVLRCYLAFGVDRVLDWHDDEGNNGIGYILHVTSRLLDPTGPVERATAGGRLVCAILMRLQSHQLGENLDLLLRGTLARLSTLPLVSESQSEGCPPTGLVATLDDDLEAGSVRGARQSLVFVFVLLFRLQPESAINFLANVPDLSGQPVMATVLRLWCASQPLYIARPQLRISIFALSNLLSHAIATKDERLMQITVEVDDLEQLGPSGLSAAARTRSKRQQGGSGPHIQVPILVVMYKRLLSELAKQLEEAEAEDDDEEEEEDEADDDDEDDEESLDEENQRAEQGDIHHAAIQSRHLGVGKSGVNGVVASSEQLDVESQEESDDDLDSGDPIYATDPLMSMNIKEHLCALLRNLSQQPFYNEFSRYHTQTELSVLRRMHIVDVTEHS